jgi:hypothetical protein
MLKFFKFSIIFSVFAIAMAINVSPVQAQDDFNISVKHNINGRSLGLEKALPVDVYVNGNNTFTFSFGDSFEASLPEGNYTIVVKLAGTGTTVMTLGPVDIPGGVDVTIRAQLSGNKTPALKVNIK